MPARCARPVRLTASQRHRLKQTARSHTSPHRDRLRAQIVLDAAGDYANAAIARRRHVGVDTVRKWRGRFAAEGMNGLADRKRCGRPSRFTAVQQAQVKALACELPATTGVPLSRWSGAELADEAVTAGVLESISASTVQRWLRRDALKPWQYRSWIAPRAPDFAPRAAVVLDLYAGRFDGEALGADDYVLCSDEKTSIQARCRCHPTLPPGRARLNFRRGPLRSATEPRYVAIYTAPGPRPCRTLSPQYTDHRFRTGHAGWVPCRHVCRRGQVPSLPPRAHVRPAVPRWSYRYRGGQSMTGLTATSRSTMPALSRSHSSTTRPASSTSGRGRRVW
jgi:transposase